MRYSSALHQMLEDIRVPAAFDLYDLQSALVCDQCTNYLGSRPVTTRCGHTYCRDCLLGAGKCPMDACRFYSNDDCPHDVVLGDLLEEIHRIIADSDSNGLWRKRKRGTHSREQEFMRVDDASETPAEADGKGNNNSPDSLEGLQLRYKKIDNEPSPPKPPVGTPGDTLKDLHSVKSSDSEKQVDLSQVDDALSDLETARSHLPNTAKLEGGKTTPPIFSPVGPQIKDFSKRMEVQYKQEAESEDNDLWKILRRNVAESFFTCSVCSNCFLEPMTLRCGHTFCRECFHQSIDQSSYHSERGFSQPTCPSCRNLTGALLPLGEALHHENTWNWTNNLHIWKLINICWIPELEESKLNYEITSRLVPKDMDYPLFICTTPIPTQPTDLRIFEAKYRTMLRRVLRTKDRTFVMSLGTGDPASPFSQVGTLLRVDNVVYQELEVAYPATIPPTKDMETYVFTRGVSRVNIEAYAQHDGYWTVRTTPFNDNDVEAEMIAETAQVGYMRLVDPLLSAVNFDPDMLTLDWLAAAMLRYPLIITRLRNTEIMQLLREFVTFEADRTGPEKWTTDIIENRGPLPQDSRPSDFSWWITGLFFRSQNDRQQLVEMTSPRERLIFLLARIGRAWPRIR